MRRASPSGCGTLISRTVRNGFFLFISYLVSGIYLVIKLAETHMESSPLNCPQECRDWITVGAVASSPLPDSDENCLPPLVCVLVILYSASLPSHPVGMFCHLRFIDDRRYSVCWILQDSFVLVKSLTSRSLHYYWHTLSYYKLQRYPHLYHHMGFI